MKNLKWNLSGLAILVGVGFVNAHLLTAGFYPKGGETLPGGKVVAVKWDTDVPHGPFQISISTNGSTWTNLTPTPADPNVETFNVTLPNTPTATARIRVCQRDYPTASPFCTDAANTSRPDQGAPWYLVSGNFTITGTSDVENPAGAFHGAEMRFDRGNLEVTFTSAAGDNALLQAFDTQGRLVATLLDGAQLAGKQRLTIFSNRLQHASSPLIFQLKVGNQVHSYNWSGSL